MYMYIFGVLIYEKSDNLQIAKHSTMAVSQLYGCMRALDSVDREVN